MKHPFIVDACFLERAIHAARSHAAGARLSAMGRHKAAEIHCRDEECCDVALDRSVHGVVFLSIGAQVKDKIR